MNNKAYILLDIVDGKAEQVAQAIQGISGVVTADAVEGPPDVVIVMEAPDREQLADLVNHVLILAEPMTEHICLLPARDKFNTANETKLSRRSRTNEITQSSKRLRLGSNVSCTSIEKGE